MSFIDEIIPFDPAIYNNDPCLVKININKITPYEKTVYLDVDMLCIADPSLFFDTIKSTGKFWIDCLRQSNENWWMRGAEMKKYGCAEVFNDVNSSVMCFDKDSVHFERMNVLYGKIDKRDLKNTWGKRHFIPDEVLHSCLLTDHIEPLHAVSYCDQDQIKESSVFISMYGYGIAKPSFKEKYDHVLRSFDSEFYRIGSIYKHKFVGK